MLEWGAHDYSFLSSSPAPDVSKVKGITITHPQWCRMFNCDRPATHVGPKSLTYCALHSRDFLKPCTKLNITCIKYGCMRYPLFGYDVPTLCVRHYKPGMINLYYPVCDTLYCYVEATHGYKTPIRCYIHAPKDMIRIRGPKCHHCDRVAIYGHGEPQFCHGHRSLTMTSYKWRACKHISCPELAEWGPHGAKYGTMCHRHRTETMTHVPHTKCRTMSCDKVATHGYGEFLLHCESHHTR